VKQSLNGSWHEDHLLIPDARKNPSSKLTGLAQFDGIRHVPNGQFSEVYAPFSDQVAVISLHTKISGLRNAWSHSVPNSRLPSRKSKNLCGSAVDKVAEYSIVTGSTSGKVTLNEIS
jgi:hypothetical protein